MIKKKYKVEGMDCTSCAMLIESDLEDLGVKAKCSFAKQTLDVEIDPKIVNEEAVKETVKSLGYSLF